MPEAQRRRPFSPPIYALRKQLNSRQLDTLLTLERVGWELKFIRRPPNVEPIAVVFDGNREHYAVLCNDGTLNEEPGFEIRH